MIPNSANLLTMNSDEMTDFPQNEKIISRVMSSPGLISDLGSIQNDADSGSLTSVSRQRIIIVANFLPLHFLKEKQTGKWCFSWDEDSLLLQLKDGLSSETEVIYVGSLKVDVDVSEQEEIAQKLLDDYKCVPTFLPIDLQKNFYHGFCKQQLWPLFHYMLPICLNKGDLFDRSLFQAYVSVNRIFADKVMEVINSDDDYVWVHDYHLMLLPTFLRKRLNRIKLGFFLHTPFPSSEIYRTLPVRDDILRGLLNSDLIGFHTFDYARHFLSCCSRMLGLNYESKRGHIGIEYGGRTVGIKILPVGVHIGRLQSLLSLPSTIGKIQEIEQKFKGQKLLVGVDDMDIFKGISLKLLALELLLDRNPDLRGKVVLVQIVNLARSSGNDVKDARAETMSLAERINLRYGNQIYNPVVLIDYAIPFHEKIAFYVAAECCIVNALRDGMNLVPYEYVVCRQGTEEMDKLRDIGRGSPRTSTLIVSEFVGCSPSLSGAFRVNPWSLEDVADALYQAIDMNESERQLRHEKHYRYVSSHHVSYWARSFTQDLERACKDHYNQRCWGVGLGLGFRVIALSPGFRKLSVGHVVSSHRRSNRRAIFLDYDGTLMPETSIVKDPSSDIISMLKTLCSDPRNNVFIVSGRGRAPLANWFSSCEALGIAAEHGYFIRWNASSNWESSPVVVDPDWMNIAEPVMTLYTEATDGSYIEVKESALVWHHQYADPVFGSCQAKELLDHLENVLANDPVVVKRGNLIVEVKPQGVGKGLVVEKLLKTLINDGKPPDFLMCIGDDRSDEDMFESIISTASSSLFPVVPEVFACTVGQKPSKAKYFVNDTMEVINLLEAIADSSSQRSKDLKKLVSFEGSMESQDLPIVSA
ncbi:probable alpha,alpha-trehalose-phosphate synthase [UDP-forming] 9 [Dendrobium catenatum]|uniref:probable alpha,alpha-trehalose-phosphate synthase [UDP-forming] 9 n=1 Tax=Dendrobium catenatum TaxID=906689 RepID=UPI0009F5DDB8|nr:probable alpha,alpha-trehalose-phosphate synthase [UDP-forming] 9 [Dendrobium catenatum]